MLNVKTLCQCSAKGQKSPTCVTASTADFKNEEYKEHAV